MASLNDIENQLDSVITSLTAGIINNIQALSISVVEGFYTFDNNVTFSDVRNMIAHNKIPILAWKNSGTIHYFYPTITVGSENTLSWFRILYRPGESSLIRISILNENPDSDNQFSVYLQDF